MPDHVDPATVIAATYGAYAIPGRRYPATLPPELEPWYLYTGDGGHSILITLGGEGEEVAAPVKAVLRTGWTITTKGYVRCDLPYDPNLGLVTDPDDDEYDDTTQATDTTSAAPPHRYAVGELYHPNHTRYPDGAIHWELSERGATMVMFMAAPTDTEVMAVRKGAAQFALLAGQHALILAHQFDPMPWSDTPWQVVRQTNATAGLPLIGAHGHLMVTVFLVDANTGIIAAIRGTTWTARFVEAVRAAIRTQSLNHSTEAQGAAEITTWYQRYPTTDKLVAAADIKTRG
ncbi:hypothetical protein [Nocardia sp. CA-120079]|uniref:hypothetical protein n=1 Tax=Nocardia sp. CA-120079 TaxID=3239974 RepID=UPI003D978376